MSQLLVAPELLASAAGDVNGISAALRAANAAAAAPTSSLVAAAGDEISTATAALFSGYAQEYQAVLKQVGAFEFEFAQALAAAASSYTQAEAAAGAALAGASNAVNAPIQSLLGQAATGGGAPVAAATTALIMGGTANPLPDLFYIADVNKNYIQKLFLGAIPQGLFTPEQFWPVTPDLGNMTYNQSTAKGVAILDAAIKHQIVDLGNKVVGFGYSQSASIVNNEILALMAAGSPYQGDLSFIMAAAGNNPNGGLLARFPGFYLPFLDVPFNGATPANNPYPTQIFTAQYDGIAHTPQYPLHILSDINAVMGYFYVHPNYPTFPATDAVPLPTSPGYTGNTQYYMFLTQDLPLLQPIRNIPYAGPPIADLFQPQLRVLVDMGYSDYGYADLPTPAGLLSIPNPINIGYYLIKGTLQAPYAAAVEIGVEAGFWGPEYFPDTYPWVPSLNPGLNIYLGPALSQPPVTALSLLSGGLGDVLHIIPPIFN
ncbi:PE family protein [Mycobacterium szulgai]|uniref:PE family protein n=1 Tax=Mycobacterium szulgai TaxID=1787 RepID=A0A1X2DQW0_MYCSZ|nr:PE-PPE domain-containing protein [Mycobacterium szulgai]ORW90059.1 PE family protein [Mycobacterium szulgai]